MPQPADEQSIMYSRDSWISFTPEYNLYNVVSLGTGSQKRGTAGSHNNLINSFFSERVDIPLTGR